MRFGGGRAFGRFFVVVASMLLVGATVARAQGSCAMRVVTGVSDPGTGRSWAAPLDRTVTVHARDLSLRDALDRVAAAAHIRISYAGDLLPLDQQVCVTYESRRVGDVLVALLRGSAVEPVVIAGSDQVVLAPAARKAAVGDAEPRLQRSIGILDRVVVTGSAVATAQRSLPVALDVVSGRQLAERDAGSMSGALDGVVPGLWLWNQSPSNMLARYGSIRGASSFGLSYPKIYIDGIEVANPLLVTQLDPQSVERVEVIRGPQGAALYGADAISGVINIVSRHGGVDGGIPSKEFRSTAGVTGSDYSANGVLAQTHALALRAGSGVRSAGLSLSLNSIGAFVPGAYARQLMATGDVRLVGSRSMVSGTARFFGANSGAPTSPLLAGVIPASTSERWSEPSSMAPPHFGAGRRGSAYDAHASPPGDSMSFEPGDTSTTQAVRQYTLGATASLQQSERWTHSITLGIDGYRLREASLSGIPFPSPADSALRAASGGADRGSARLSSVARVGAAERTAATITFAAEHSTVREQNDGEAPYAPPQNELSGAYGNEMVAWRSNTGLVAQTTVSFGEDLFLTAGTRLERSSVGGVGQTSTLPMLGASFVRELGDVTLKLRSAYGKGIRAPQTTSRTTSSFGMRRTLSTVSLAAEEQSGTEVGADLFLGRRVVLHVTRFDQLASGLIQPVAVAQSHAPNESYGMRRIPYQLQNVGEISNRGWEMEGSLAAGSFAAGSLLLSGTLSLVDSRVRQLARGYTGDLLPGDRMLEVPARTMSLNAAWSGSGWSASWGASRASDWINYDRLALAQALAASSLPPHDLVGGQLRSYWREYDGVTRLRGSLSRELRRGLSLLVSGDNLLGRQYGEPDNVTVLPGRTITAGLRARF